MTYRYPTTFSETDCISSIAQRAILPHEGLALATPWPCASSLHGVAPRGALSIAVEYFARIKVLPAGVCQNRSVQEVVLMVLRCIARIDMIQNLMTMTLMMMIKDATCISGLLDGCILTQPTQ